MLNRFVAAQRVDQVEAAAQGAEHAQGEDVDRRGRPRRSSLSHWITVRSAKAAFSTVESGCPRLLGDDEAAGAAIEVARKPIIFSPGQGQHPAIDSRIEAGLFQAFSAGGPCRSSGSRSWPGRRPAWATSRPWATSRTAPCRGRC